MLVSGYSYVNNKKAIESLSGEVIDEINQLVFQESKNYLMTAVDMTELSSRISGEGLGALENNTRLDSLMMNVLTLHNQLLNFEIGDEDGNFLMQKREQDGTISTKIIRRTGDNVSVKWKHRDKNGTISEIEDPKDKTGTYFLLAGVILYSLSGAISSFSFEKYNKQSKYIKQKWLEWVVYLGPVVNAVLIGFSFFMDGL